MEVKFLKLLCDPVDSGELTCHQFVVVGENIIDGILINENKGRSYAIIGGVPIMLPGGFTDSFLVNHKERVSEINQSQGNKLSFEVNDSQWSFSNEWDSFFKDDMELTWDWTVKDRFEQFLLETGTELSDLKSKTVLDAGCGNGMLTSAISDKSKMTIGFDLSESVMYAEKNRKNRNLFFVRGDLQKLPFKDGNIDILVSNGVIHHTPNTKNTFSSIAKVVKPGGKLYIWLYSQKGNFGWTVKRKFFDYTRAVVSRLPSGAQDRIVEGFTSFFHAKDKKRDRREVKISMYDSITPRWRHYHTPEEVSFWYREYGFGPITLTHFDNKYGFGVCGTKSRTSLTPGDHFGNKSNKGE